jgi:hypothetical protein
MATARKCPKCSTELTTGVPVDRYPKCLGQVVLGLGQQAGGGSPESETSTKSEVPEEVGGTVKVEPAMVAEATETMIDRYQLLPKIGEDGCGLEVSSFFLLTTVPSKDIITSMNRRNQVRRCSVRGKFLRYRAEYFHKLAFPFSRFGEWAFVLALTRLRPAKVLVQVAAPYLWLNSLLKGSKLDSLATITRTA